MVKIPLKQTPVTIITVIVIVLLFGEMVSIQCHNVSLILDVVDELKHVCTAENYILANEMISNPVSISNISHYKTDARLSQSNVLSVLRQTVFFQVNFLQQADLSANICQHSEIDLT